MAPLVAVPSRSHNDVVVVALTHVIDKTVPTIGAVSVTVKLALPPPLATLAVTLFKLPEEAFAAAVCAAGGVANTADLVAWSKIV